MATLTATQARKQFFGLQTLLFEDHVPVEIQFKKGNAVLLGKDDYENLLEHLYILSDSEVVSRMKNIDHEPRNEYISLEALQYELEHRNSQTG